MVELDILLGRLHPGGAVLGWWQQCQEPAMGNRSPSAHLPVHSAEVPGVTQSE